MDAKRVARAVERWARENLEKLPWRGERSLYRLLVAEILLKRTTRKAASLVYMQFIEKYPTLEDLCKASVEEVEQLLRPIGLYNQRARQLVQICEHRHVLEKATTWRELARLPGVGEYTAKAIGAILFGERVIGIDGNVKRLLVRVFGRYDDKIADALAMEAEDTRLLQLGLVDLGYRICAPRRPKCNKCPLAETCLYTRQH
ncbi:A/G-specific DNA glycosylase [Pyrobaculum oguniense TE7]|uniref:A/G-specific DNA glycosylase n=1 Tax=Pyrobaculum oguniense (strain DSM 13380 / JCM 10595 / TE7) TaxID=698757 RepID=H6Q772_PYROT|nr:A/G-specific DNA glycosylase [Pyrobaculum oguniense TE7]